MKKIREIFENIVTFFDDIATEYSWGYSIRFIIANIILGDRLRQTVSFSVVDIKQAKRYLDLAPDFALRKLDQVIEMLQELPKP